MPRRLQGRRLDSRPHLTMARNPRRGFGRSGHRSSIAALVAAALATAALAQRPAGPGPAEPDRRREAMREWHASFEAALAPVVVARRELYRRMPHRFFAAVRPQCQEVARAVDAAAALYEPAPLRHVEVLARDLLLVYRDSARFCARGAYFSFTVEEGRVRRLVAGLIAALDAYGLDFPVAPRSAPADRSAPLSAPSTTPGAPPMRPGRPA
jgi:hypothetical protein